MLGSTAVFSGSLTEESLKQVGELYMQKKTVINVPFTVKKCFRERSLEKLELWVREKGNAGGGGSTKHGAIDSSSEE